MLLDRLFRPAPAEVAGRALYARAVDQSREEGLYTRLGVPDTVEGRFEIYTLHVVLLLDRLRREGDAVRELSQGLFDTYVKALDNALREMGVGDLSVGRKMRKLGEAFYGRGKSYDAAFAALPDTGMLHALMTRTIYADQVSPRVRDLTDYVLAQRATLAGQSAEALARGEVAWAPA